MLLKNVLSSLLLLLLSSYFFQAHAQMYDDSLAVDRHLAKISSTEYLNAVLHFTQKEKKEPLDKLAELGLYLDSECDEICETYLKEKKGKGKMLLPSDFDQGVQGLVFSPADKTFVIYSSYDGPDYNSFYHYRAEIIAYPLYGTTGLDAIGNPAKYHLYDWSIDDLFWIDDKTIAIKAYQGLRAEGGNEYFKLRLK